MPVISARKLAQTEDGQTNSQLTALKNAFHFEKALFPSAGGFHVSIQPLGKLHLLSLV